MKQNRKSLLGSGLTIVAACLSLAGCQKAADVTAAPPPPPEVGIMTLQPRSVQLSTQLPGRTVPYMVAEVRPQVGGILRERAFTEGSDVKTGQPLYRIDPAPYQATLQSAQAQLAQAQAQLAQTSATVTRYRPLVAANAVSKQEFDAAVAAEKAAQAQVAAARAAIKSADINVGYATVTAPISGRIGRALVTEGALVGQGDATQLAVIQQINPLYLNITQSASDAMKLRQQLSKGQLERDSGAQSVKIVLEDGTEYSQPGRLLFSDQTVDPATGQILLRAEVPNPQGVLLPGLYVRAVIEQAQVANAALLPQQAVTRGSHGDSVMVVAADGTVAPRPIKIGGQKGTDWIVTEGLKPGEQVMVEGAMKLMFGAKTVKPVAWDPNKPKAGAHPAAAAPASGASGAPAAASASAPAAAPASAASR